MRYINDIIIHCTATPAGMEVTAADVDSWHRQRGWRCIGYHYLVRLDGTVERGRAISQPGSHCFGHNAHSIGIAYAGGLDAEMRPADTRTEAQRAALLKLVTHLTAMYRCRVHGHRDYAPRDCPCFDVASEYGRIYEQICKIDKRKS